MKLLIFLLLPLVYSCTIKNEVQESKVYSELNKSFKDTLRVEKTNSSIVSMELTVTGNITGKGKLIYSHSPFEIERFIELKDSVNEKIETDWYDERCLILFEPQDSFVKGEIKIDFKAY